MQSQKIIYIWKFQLTRSRGARHCESIDLYAPSLTFQLTRSRGARRLFQTLGMYSSSAFQLTRSRGARLFFLCSLALLKNHFNSRAHVERDWEKSTLRRFLNDFNSRAHVERELIFLRSLAQGVLISTHALTWSATLAVVVFYVLFCEISTHALTWSATREICSITCAPRQISTHALTWSATILVELSALPILFQLTRSRGARP